jgi:hypothetical protein
MLNPISTKTDQDYGQVALIQMTGTNSLVNLPVEAPITIRSYWLNEVTGIQESSNTTVVVPPGQYSYESMLAFWNTYVPTFSDDPYVDTCYGLGGNPGTYPSLNKYEYNIRFTLQQYAAILAQTFDGNKNLHLYKGFEIEINPLNYRLFVMLGFREILNPEIATVPTTFLQFPVTVESRVYDNMTDETSMTYNVQQPILAPFAFDFSGSKSLYVYIETPVNSQFRAPFNQNDSSNLIARVPVNVPFGFQYEFIPNNVVYSQQKNLNISQMVLTCRDEYGTFVDFQNLPWFVDLSIKFGASEDEISSSAYTGSMDQVVSNPSLHPTAASFNSGNRDPLYGGQKNINPNTQAAKRFRS